MVAQAQWPRSLFVPVPPALVAVVRTTARVDTVGVAVDLPFWVRPCGLQLGGAPPSLCKGTQGPTVEVGLGRRALEGPWVRACLGWQPTRRIGAVGRKKPLTPTEL